MDLREKCDQTFLVLLGELNQTTLWPVEHDIHSFTPELMRPPPLLQHHSTPPQCPTQCRRVPSFRSIRQFLCSLFVSLSSTPSSLSIVISLTFYSFYHSFLSLSPQPRRSPPVSNYPPPLIGRPISFFTFFFHFLRPNPTLSSLPWTSPHPSPTTPQWILWIVPYRLR